MAIKLADVDITEQIPEISGLDRYSECWVLVREKTVPVGYARIQNCGTTISKERLECEIAKQFPQDLHAHCEPEESSQTEEYLPSVSVIICTVDRPDTLKRTLESIFKQDYPKFEVIVVNNCPPSDTTRKLVEKYHQVRYILETLPGTNRARNRGIEASEGEIIAFIDDDAVADPKWLRGLSAGFANPKIACVTGLILPAELETDAQELFETGYGGFGVGFQRKTLKIDTWKYAQFLPDIGSGCNMAFRRDLLVELGMFDIVIDGGMPVAGGGEIDMFHRVLRAGFSIEYRPEALMFHTHRRSYAELREQVCGYSKAYTGLITKWFIEEPDQWLKLIQFVGIWYKAWFLPRIKRKLLSIEKTPTTLMALEAIHSLCGPALYLRSIKYAQLLERHRLSSTTPV